MHPHFYYVKSSPFLNPPSARRPISENLPAADGLTHGNIIFSRHSTEPVKARIGVSNVNFPLEIPVKIDKRFCGMTFYLNIFSPLRQEEVSL